MEKYTLPLSEFLYKDIIGIILEYITKNNQNVRKIFELTSLKGFDIIGVSSDRIYVLGNNGIIMYTSSNNGKLLFEGNFIKGIYLEFNNHLLLLCEDKTLIIVDISTLSIIKKITDRKIRDITCETDHLYLITAEMIIEMSYTYEFINKINHDFHPSFSDTFTIYNKIIYKSNTTHCGTNIYHIINGEAISIKDDKIFEFIKSRMLWSKCGLYNGITSTNIFIFYDKKLVVFDHNYNKILDYYIDINICEGLIVYDSYILFNDDKYKICVLERY